MKKNPYIQYGSSKLWKVLNSALDDLVKNQDIEEKTSREYIIGYLCSKIFKSKSSNTKKE